MKETCTNPNPDCDCSDYHAKDAALQAHLDTIRSSKIRGEQGEPCRNDGVIPDNCPDCFPFPCIHQ